MAGKALQSTEKNLQNLTEESVFEPSTNQQFWLDMAIQIRSDSPSEIESACKEAGNSISRQSWYDWKEDQKFVNWFYSQWKEKRKEWLVELDAIGMKMAKRGDYNFWKDMKRTVGDYPEESRSPGTLQQFNLGGKEGNTITFVNFKNESES